MRGHIVVFALLALCATVAVAEEPVRINMFRGMWADAPEEQKGPLCDACINLVEQLVPSLIDPDVQQNVRKIKSEQIRRENFFPCSLSTFSWPSAI